MIKVLIVEDSRVVSQYLEYIFSSDPNIEVIGNVSNGKAAISFIEKRNPDVITMDIDMPIMNGLEATRIIMSTKPIPIIVVTASRNAHEVDITMEALAAGALSVIDKPAGIGHPNEKEKAEKMLTMVKILSEVKVVRRIPKKQNNGTVPVSNYKNTVPLKACENKKIIAIGISSGGPQVLEKIFSRISQCFPYPIVVVQHITEGFIDGLVRWLNRLLKIPVNIAQNRENILPGNIYFAPDNHHMGILNYKINLVECDYELGKLCPSVEHLFGSLAIKHAPDTMAMLLTGMGRDGASELKILRDAGALTIAQDKDSSLVHGMPGVAISLDAADYVLNPDEIAQLLFDIEMQATPIKQVEKESRI